MILIGKRYCQFESQIQIHNQDFLDANDIQPNLIFSLITGSISNLLQHKLICHSVINKSLLVMPYMWFKQAFDNYGSQLIFEKFKKDCISVNLKTAKDYMKDMTLRATRVLNPMDKLQEIHKYFFKEILIHKNVASVMR